MTLSACTDAPDEVATFQHDFGTGGTLRAYAAAADGQRQADQVATRAYGTQTQSPRTPYLCVWRDTGPGRFRAAGGAPTELFLTCVFGSDAWTPPPNLLQEAEARARRDEAVLRAQWRRNGSSWPLTRLEVEIHRGTNPDPDARFRSVHFEDELAAVTLRESEIAFPASAKDPVRFRIVASLPRRRNRGEPVSAPAVALTIAGTAQPMPDWMNY